MRDDIEAALILVGHAMICLDYVDSAKREYRRGMREQWGVWGGVPKAAPPPLSCEHALCRLHTDKRSSIFYKDPSTSKQTWCQTSAPS